MDQQSLDCVCSLYTSHSSNSAGAAGTTDPQSSQSPNSEPQSGTVQLIMLQECINQSMELTLQVVYVGIANEIIICTVIVSLFPKWLWLQ